jgi:DNA polymerase-3 subunit gamma/tau
LIWEDDPRIGKLSGIIEALNEDMDTIGALPRERTDEKKREDPQALCDRILKNAFKLEGEGVGKLIPVGHIRRASWWSHLAPAGRGKLLLIENADRMQEGGHNALLKMLEEPPERLTIALTTSSGGSMLPTILSRLRPYRFFPRDRDSERELIRRVFRNAGAETGANPVEPKEGEGGLIAAYLDSFLPVSGEALYGLAAFFAASLAGQGAAALRRRGVSLLPPALAALGKYTVPIAEGSGYGKPAGDTGNCVAIVLKGAGNFAVPGLFRRFLGLLLNLVSQSLRELNPPGGIGLADVIRRLTGETETAVETYNQSPALALDRYCTEFRRMAADL